jgi:hypothetical protein
MTTTPTTDRRRLADTITDGLLVAIVLSVGVMAGAASFNHVHDWTMAHSPAGTASWFGWANAVITELIPTAALIIIARRRRTGSSTGYPMFLLITAVALSLTAQLAVAERSPFGWMVSALPACAFFALSKLVFTTTPTPAATPATAPANPPATAPAALSTSDTVTSTMDTATSPVTRPAKKAAPRKATPAKKTTTAKAVTGTKPAASRARKASTPATTAIASATEPLTINVPAHLVPSARFAVTNHEQTTGRPITADELAARLSIAAPLAASLLADLNPNTPTTISHANGTPTTVGGAR